MLCSLVFLIIDEVFIVSYNVVFLITSLINDYELLKLIGLILRM